MQAGLRAAVIAIAAAGLLGGCASASKPGQLGDDDAAATAKLPPVHYEVTFPGDLPADLATLLPQVSKSAATTETPPTSRLGIRQRAEGDVTLLQQALRAEGYFDGSVSFRVEDPTVVPARGIVEDVKRLATAPAAILVFDVQPGPQYQFGQLSIRLDGATTFDAPTPTSLGLDEGAPARTQVVLDAEQKLLSEARKAGFALAKLGEREAIVDHETRHMNLTLALEPGRVATFGDVTFSGGEGIDPGFLRGRVPIKAGERYDPALVTDGQQSLFDTNLFSTIIIQPADQLTADGQLDLRYELKQRPPRSIGAEINYETDLGPGGSVFWEHRNVFGAGERFRAELAGSEVQQSATLSLTKPDFFSPRQNLLMDATARRDRLEAYDSDSLGSGVSVERQFTKEFKASLGVAFRYVWIKDHDQPETTFGLLSLPATIDWNFADDRFNPTAGGTVQFTGAPYTDVLGPSLNFAKGRLTTTRYIRIAQSPELVLALRGSVGSLVGAQRNEVPADERFYAGGGGSIRGIGFELAGPLNDDDKPIGGRSVAEGSIELRSRWGENLGAVLFLDAGTVDSSVLPSGGERVLFGAGPGIRYYTPIGPVRVDLGFPLNPRAGVDDPFQLYFSLGQAF